MKKGVCKNTYEIVIAKLENFQHNFLLNKVVHIIFLANVRVAFIEMLTLAYYDSFNTLPYT